MKKFMLAAAFAAIALFQYTPETLAAEWQPSGPIKLMIAFRAGGGADTQARLIGEEMEARYGWKVIPEQVTGKGGAVLAAKLKDAPKDGLTIGMLVSESLGYNMVAAKNAGYGQDDFTALTTTAGFQMGVVALTSKGWSNFADVINAAKSGEVIRFGAMSPRLADLAYLMGKSQGVDFNIIMAQGGKGVMNGLNAGDMDIGWGAGIQTKAVLAGDMINLASGLSTKLKISPEAPTMGDLGVNYNADGYFMFAAPAGIPADARDALTSAIVEIVMDSNSKAGQFITKAFGGAVAISGNDLTRFLKEDVAAAEALLKAVSE